MHPSGKFHNGNTMPGIWLEVSVCGKLFSLRGSRSAQNKGEIVCNMVYFIFNKTYVLIIINKYIFIRLVSQTTF